MNNVRKNIRVALTCISQINVYKWHGVKKKDAIGRFNWLKQMLHSCLNYDVIAMQMHHHTRQRNQ